MRDEGGIYAQLFQNVLYKPFTRLTGIEVARATSEPAPAAQIQMMVETKRYLWDIAVISQPVVLSLTVGNDCFLEKHRLEHEPAVSSILPQFSSPYGVGTYVYTTMLAYRTDAFNGCRTPETWQDLWDVNHFPGRRGLFKFARATLEVALMADGVAPGEVYPCDLERAFRSLDKIKSHITLWWTSGPQIEQALKAGELDLTSAFNIRAQAAIGAGSPVTFSWDQHIYGCNCWAILKGTPNVEACRQFIKFASHPKRQALLAPYGIAPTHPDAFNYIDAKHAKLLPTYPDNLKKGLYTDPSYWLKNQDEVFKRFNDWRVS